VIELVLSFHLGDTATLCAAACVARAWREAARQPRLWRSLVFSNAKYTRTGSCTTKRLAALVARAQGKLECLHLDDFARHPHAWYKQHVSASGVVAALRGNAPLRELRVRGLRTDGASFAELRALVVQDSSLDVANGATCFMWLKSERELPCGRLCDLEHDLVCQTCNSYCCVKCRPRYERRTWRCCGECEELDFPPWTS
jgi:hypothetical protein